MNRSLNVFNVNAVKKYVEIASQTRDSAAEFQSQFDPTVYFFFFPISPGQLSETLQLRSSVRSSYPTRIVCSPCQPYKCCRVTQIQVHVLRDTFPWKVMVMFCLAVTSTLCFLRSVSLPPSGWPHPPLQHFFPLSFLSPAHTLLSALCLLCACVCVPLLCVRVGRVSKQLAVFASLTDCGIIKWRHSTTYLSVTRDVFDVIIILI